MRRIAMVQMIPTYPSAISTAEVHEKLAAAGYVVERRTVQRDLLDFSQVFHYLSEERGKPIYWYWSRDSAAVSIRSISPEAALALTLAERELQGLLPDAALTLLEPYFEQARQSLDGEYAKRFASWRDKLKVVPRGPTFESPRILPAVQSTIFEALLSDRQIKARYRSRGSSNTKETILHPLGIVSRHGVIYLVATAWQYQDPYHYALQRFTAAEMLDEPVIRSNNFRLDSYVRDTRAFDLPTGDGTIRLKLEVEANTAIALLERPLSSDQKSREMEDGGYRIEATVQDTMELRWWLLGLGANVKVLGPASIKHDIVQELRTALEAYD